MLLSICNGNWLSSDLHAHTLAAVVTSQFPNALSYNGTSATLDPAKVPEFGTGSMLQALARGDCAIVPECWDYAHAPCNGRGGTVVDVGMTGENGLYAPKWMLEKYPFMASFPAGYADELAIPSDFEILGVSGGWSVEGEGVCLQEASVTGADPNASFIDAGGATVECDGYIPSHLLSKFAFPSSGADLTERVQRALKWRKPILFYGWTPGPLTDGNKMVERISVFGQPVALKLVHSARLGPNPLLARVLAERWRLTPANMTFLMTKYQQKASVALPTGHGNRRHGLSFAAYGLLCEQYGDCERSSLKQPLLRPGLKDPRFPEKLVIWLKPFPSFVDSADRPGSLKDKSFLSCNVEEGKNWISTGRQDLAGYTVDHLTEVFRLLGYRRDELVLRCANSTSELIDIAVEGRTDVSVAAITVTHARMALVDFSSPFFTTGYRIMVRQRPVEMKELDDAFIFQPLENAVWAAYLSLMVAISIMIFVIERCHSERRKALVDNMMKQTDEEMDVEAEEAFRDSPAGRLQRMNSEDVMALVEPSIMTVLTEQEKEALQDAVRPKPSNSPAISDRMVATDGRKELIMESAAFKMEQLRIAKQFNNHMYSMAGVMLGIDSGGQTVKTMPGRTLYFCMLLLGMMFFFPLYTAGLAALLTNREKVLPITTLDDVKSVAVSFPINGTNVPKQWIESNGRSTKISRASGYLEMADMVMGEKVDGAVYDEPALTWLAGQSDCSSKLQVVGDLFGPQEYAYAFPKGSVLRDAVSEAVTYLRTSKYPDFDSELRGKWMPEQPACSEEVDIGQIKMDDLKILGSYVLCFMAIVFVLWVVYEIRVWRGVWKVIGAASDLTGHAGAAAGRGLELGRGHVQKSWSSAGWTVAERGLGLGGLGDREAAAADAGLRDEANPIIEAKSQGVAPPPLSSFASLKSEASPAAEPHPQGVAPPAVHSAGASGRPPSRSGGNETSLHM